MCDIDLCILVGKTQCCTAKARNTVRLQLKSLDKDSKPAFVQAKELKLLVHYEVRYPISSVEVQPSNIVQHADRCEAWLESLNSETRQSRKAA
jgi:hypothetical protein